MSNWEKPENLQESGWKMRNKGSSENTVRREVRATVSEHIALWSRNSVFL